ncbi:response regulator [Microvirga calopogonii]|uniref:response regulator n=1 Tax=Microvirga calopogonii TaxID=2078013 RepID=UPI000E0D55AD|nr:response regulator [Microvirga calopogonii]
MSTVKPHRILIADNTPITRETVAQRLRAQGHEVITVDTGEKVLLALRDWSRPIGWLYTRAALSGLVDGWILADEYHDMHKDRAVILAGSEQRVSARGDLVLKQPTPVEVCHAIHQALVAEEATAFVAAQIGIPQAA